MYFCCDCDMGVSVLECILEALHHKVEVFLYVVIREFVVTICDF